MHENENEYEVEDGKFVRVEWQRIPRTMVLEVRDHDHDSLCVTAPRVDHHHGMSRNQSVR